MCTLSVIAHKSAAERREEVQAISKRVDLLWDEWKSRIVGNKTKSTGVCEFAFRPCSSRLVPYTSPWPSVYVEEDTPRAAARFGFNLRTRPRYACAFYGLCELCHPVDRGGL